jgi:acetyl esterase
MTEIDEAHGISGADVDPEIRQFQQYLSRAFASYPAFSTISTGEARRIAETVRAPLVRGGPSMARTLDRTIAIDGNQLPIRVYFPTLEAGLPALIYLHGGGWTLFSINTHDRVMREYAARAQVVVVAVDYPLSPEAKFPQALDQITALVGWLAHQGSVLGIDPSKLAIGGDSAGANLAIGAALSLRRADKGNMLRALLLNYGVYDCNFGRRSYLRYGNDDYMLTVAEMITFWDNYVGHHDDRSNPLACPLRADLRGLPTAFLAIAECDALYDENIDMAAQLRAAGVTVESVIYPGATHSFLEAVSMAAVSNRAFDDEAQWLRRIFGETR